MSIRASLARLAAICLVLMVAGCTTAEPAGEIGRAGGVPPMPAEESAAVVERALVDGINRLAAAISATDSTLTFVWSDDRETTSCGTDPSGTATYLPHLVARRIEISDRRWQDIVELARQEAAELKLDHEEGASPPSGSRELRFTDSTGAALRVSYRTNLVLTGFTGCRAQDAPR